jgi:hypothetical protein
MQITSLAHWMNYFNAEPSAGRDEQTAEHPAAARSARLRRDSGPPKIISLTSRLLHVYNTCNFLGGGNYAEKAYRDHR